MNKPVRIKSRIPLLYLFLVEKTSHKFRKPLIPFLLATFNGYASKFILEYISNKTDFIYMLTHSNELLESEL